MKILLKNTSPIAVESVVRVVPQQREVVRGAWQGQLVYAKQFTGNRAKKHFERDVAGVQRLVNAHISTPALLFQGVANVPNTYVAIYAAITPSQNAEEFYAQLANSERFELMQQLVQTVASHHKAGLIQADLYFKNFLVTSDEKTAKSIIYTLDGDGIQPLSIIFKKYQQQQNLATLFSKMDVLDEDAWLQDLYQDYCVAMGMPFSVEAMSNIWRATQIIRQQVASGYADKKVFRTCTDVKVTRHRKYFIVTARAFLVDETTLQNLDIFLEHAAHNIKNGNTCTIAKAEIANREVVVKRYNVKGFLHGLSRAFRQTRAAVSWANAHRLKLLGVVTAKPIALIEQRNFCLFKSKAYFLAEYVDALDVAQFFAKTRGKTQRAEAIKNIVTLFYKLYLLQISHGDMKASNLKISGFQPVLIDLDSMHQHQSAFFFERAHVRDLRRFMQNWQDDNALYNAFVKTFRVVYEDFEPLEKAGIFNNKELT